MLFDKLLTVGTIEVKVRLLVEVFSARFFVIF
jgi:hypothetical protein